MDAQSTYLYFTEGSSDKVYNVHLRPSGDGWLVDFENGRRGKALRSGTKTKDPIPYEKALALFNKTVKGKVSGGYTEEESGQAFAGTDKAGEVTGFRPPLLNEVTEEEALALVATGDWLLQQKHDGERRGSTWASELVFSNRKGLRVGVAQDIQDAVEALTAAAEGSFEFDAEDMGSHLCIFDVFEIDGKDLRELPFEARAKHLTRLEDMIANAGAQAASTLRIDHPIQAPKGAEMKRLLEDRRAQGHEGIVLRHKDGKATAGRPASGGHALKLKFWESCTVRVAKASETKRSISVELKDEAGWVPVGNCTIPANHQIPQAGAYAEIRYLYAYKGGSLYQPTYLGPRADVSEEDATAAQLKFVSEPA